MDWEKETAFEKFVTVRSINITITRRIIIFRSVLRVYTCVYMCVYTCVLMALTREFNNFNFILESSFVAS